MKSLSKIILAVAALVSLGLVVGTYTMFSGFGERMMQRAAFSQSQVVARLTFSNMYQLMNQGWKRDQVITFTKSATDSLAGSPLKIQFYRGEAVNRSFGPVIQPPPDAAVAEALRTGRSSEVASADGARFIHALKADDSCLRCHVKAARGDVLGVISVESRYEKFIDDSRKLLMLILLLLAPTPFIAAWLVAVYFDRRVDRFVEQIDKALDAAGAGGPDFTGVKPAWSELETILQRFRRMAAR
mgnify:CR=1 FL=1